MNIRISPLSLGSLILRPRKVIGCVIALALAIVIGVFVIGAALFFSYQRHQWLEKLTAEAPAQVLAVKVTRQSTTPNQNNSQNQNAGNNSTPTFSTRITYSFQADGRTIETEWVKSGDVSEEYEVGRRAKVCYEPANPNNNEIFPLSYRCGQ
ncbi:MAG TPA: DUF3592 domain-containing protein [Pyrinomonadaceae bacterium]|jgi:hypothetical protein|nr:DUF3592 domain-containing protein [Pyrinomonadaceae bacterium]